MMRGVPHRCLFTSVVIKAVLANDRQSVWAMSEFSDAMGLKPWSLAQVTFEDGLLVQASHGAFFTEEGAEKKFTRAQGLEWTGGDSIDDYAQAGQRSMRAVLRQLSAPEADRRRCDVRTNAQARALRISSMHVVYCGDSFCRRMDQLACAMPAAAGESVRRP